MENFGFPSKMGLMKVYRFSRSYARDLKIGRQTNKANKYYSCYDLKDPLFTNPFTAAKTAQRNGGEIDKLTSNRLLAEYNDDQWICYASQTTQNQNYQVVDMIKVLKKLRFEIF